MLDFTPKSTAEMVFANADTQSILNDILLGKISFPSNGKNSLLLYGVFGSGKTTYANIFFNEYDKSFQNEVWQACAREPLFWLNTFGFTYDPRLPVGLQSLPFITYDIQDELVYEICQALGYYDILIEKSRDEGVSWICLSVVSHQWQFHHEQQFMMTSRKQDYVDKRGNKDCLFWKFRFSGE